MRNRLRIITLFSIFALMAGCSKQEVVPDAAAPPLTPQEKRLAELAGTDADHNGIRDDVDKWINRQSFDVHEKNAVEQLAKSMQAVLTIPGTEGAAKVAVDAEFRSMDCLRQRIGSAKERVLTKKTIAASVNTKERVLQYDKVSELVSGATFDVPSSATLAKMKVCDD